VQTIDPVPCPSEPAIPAIARTTTQTRGVGLLGCGTVGAGVARRLLVSHPGLIRGIAVRDPRKSRDLAWQGYLDDPFAVVDDPSVGVVIECIGGLGLARELVLRAIARGKDVVTANKDLIATEGPWLAAFAARTGASLRYEAAVGGAIPIVRALGGALAGEDVLEVGGVLNGTTNFVLDAMAEGAEYADALGEAQRLGFAESDPRSDVDGHDAAHKLAILAGLAFRRPSTSAPLARRGIGALTQEDVRAGAERGLRLKLLAIARRVDEESIEAAVTPAYVPADHPFARPRGAENIVRVHGRGCGTLTFGGAGAGGDATASAVVADVLAALESNRRPIVAHEGNDLIARPLRAPLFVRFAQGEAVTTAPIALDQLSLAGAGYDGRGEVRSVIPVWIDAA
jgi:homoserine dehydrogenase